MKNDLTYQQAFDALEQLVAEVEDEAIQLDTLAEKIQQANDLVAFCEQKLRVIDSALKEAISGNAAKLK